MTRRAWLMPLVAVMLLAAGGGAAYWGLMRSEGQLSTEAHFTVAQVKRSLENFSLLEHPTLMGLVTKLREASPRARLAREEVLQSLLGLLLDRDANVRGEAAQALAQLKDESVVPYLLEVLQFETPLSPTYEKFVAAWVELSGVQRPRDMDWWAREFERWWRKHPQAPDGFIHWKIQLYTTFVPSFEEFLYPGVPHTIPLETIVWGGVPKDAIAALNDPEVVSASEADYLLDDEIVFGVYLNGEARAYSLRFLDWHELVNDEVGGEPIALSDCTLCGSAILYSRRVGERVLTFGTSGLLFQSNKLMYDAETKTLWINFLGKPVVGPLATQEDLRIKAFPLTQTTWEQWKTEHPDTTVLAPLIRESAERAGEVRIVDERGLEPYAPGSAYREYRQSIYTFFPVVERDERLAPKEWVFGLVINGEAKAYPVKMLIPQGAVNDSVGRTTLVLFADSEAGLDLWGQGGAVRAYARSEHQFTRAANGEIRDEAGQMWKLTEDYLLNEVTGEKLARLNGHKAYWFAWSAFYPKTLLYEQP